MDTSVLLAGVVLLPLLASLIVALLPAGAERLFRPITLFTLLLVLAGSVGLYAQAFNFSAGEQDGAYAFVASLRMEWFRVKLPFGWFSADFFLALDGLNAAMVLLSGIVLLSGAVAAGDIHSRVRGFYALYLLLTAAIMGCFLAQDFLLFYLFFEFMLLPMYFLIGIWGGERREYAAIKFFIYTLVGSLLILVVMVGLYLSAYSPEKTAVQAGLVASETLVSAEVKAQLAELLRAGQVPASQIVHSFSFADMAASESMLPGGLLAPVTGEALRLWAFLLLLVGFAIKLPAVPVHTWLPDAHVEAPTSISVVLAGVLLKVGGYGLLRIAWPVFPEAVLHFQWWIALMGVVAIVYAGLIALGTRHLKRMIAYSSVSHMGFVLLGMASLTSEGLNGAVYQMFSHGVISSALFLVAGVLYHRNHDLQTDHYSGLSALMPRYAVLTAAAFFAGLGLPGFSSFVAELLVLAGGFRSAAAGGLPVWMPIAALSGLLIGAAYFLWTFQRVFLGPLNLHKPEWKEALTDLTPVERVNLLVLLLLAFITGILPRLLLGGSEAGVQQLLHHIAGWTAQ